MKNHSSFANCIDVRLSWRTGRVRRTALRLGLALGLAVATLRAEEPAAKLHVYLGNLHSHTGYSDGKGTPAEAYAYARDVAKLDFLAITEHNHLIGGYQSKPEQRVALYTGPGKDALVQTAKRSNVDGKFVAIYGQEFSTMSKGNHVNVFDVSEVIDVPSGEFKTLLTWMQKHPDSTGKTPVLQLNHPALGGPPNKRIGPKEYGRDDFGDDAGWLRNIGGAATLIEILNGEPPEKYEGTRSPQIMEDFFLRYLQLGFHVAPTGDQDNHRANWGTATQSRTGVIAPALTTKDLLEAMRARHVYATEDKNLRVIARVNGHLCGDILTAPEKAATIEFQIEDADEPKADYTVEVFEGKIGGPIATVVRTQEFHGNTPAGAITGVRLDQDKQYVFLRVTQKGTVTDRVWTAPVWLQTVTPPSTPVPGK